ncbi:MAG: hypothetical protein OCC49_13570 [Fibrobacterales bacterium]
MSIFKNKTLLGVTTFSAALMFFSACTDSPLSSISTDSNEKVETSIQEGYTKNDNTHAIEEMTTPSIVKKGTSEQLPVIGYVGRNIGDHSINMDDEDYKNASEMIWSSEARSEETAFRQIGGFLEQTTITFNTYEVSELERINQDYAVLSVSGDCPTNGYKFTRYFDNQDYNNKNSISGDFENIWQTPGNTYISFCLVLADPDSRSKSPYHFGTSNLILGVGDDTDFGRGYIYIDDEDSRNANRWDTDHTDLLPRMQEIVSGGRNTKIHIRCSAYQPTLKD